MHGIPSPSESSKILLLHVFTQAIHIFPQAHVYVALLSVEGHSFGRTLPGFSLYSPPTQSIALNEPMKLGDTESCVGLGIRI